MNLGIPGLEGAEPVGQGGFATVYKAYQPAFARTVAVKVLTSTDLDEIDRLRFERELHALGLLSDHPGIVNVYETGFTTDGRPYLTMTFVEEGTLDDRLRTRGAIPWPEAVTILIRLAGALETAHRSGVIHRDIKPANVLLARYGAQLSDFGIARIAGANETQAGVVTASVAYASPEVMDGGRPTVLDDVYSLGSTAYAMLLGRPPYERAADEMFVSLLMRIHTEPPPDLRGVGVPADLAALLERTLSKDPADRPRSALEFGQGLQDVMRAHGQQVPDLILAPDLVAAVDDSLGRTTDEPTTSPGGSDESHASIPVFESMPERPRQSRRLAVGVFVAFGLVAAAAAGVIVALGGGGEAGDAGEAGQSRQASSTVTEPIGSGEPLVASTPDTGPPAETSVPDSSPSSEPADSVVAPPEATTLPPISAEPVCGASTSLLPAAGEAVSVILDTGVGVGVDDVGALAILHALADAGEVDILATMVAVGGDAAAGRSVDAINTYYGRPDLAIGVVSGPATASPSAYTAQLAANFPNDLVDVVPAVDLYRQVLAGQPDNSVTIISTGFLTNLADLLASPSDDVSGLAGQELIASRVNRWVAMGGAYPDSTTILGGPEFNFAGDAAATQSVVSQWPTPAVFSGFEVGIQIVTGAVLQTGTSADNPVREAYRLSGAVENADSFDLTAVLGAVRGTSTGAFEVCSGRNIVGPGGSTTWENRAGDRQGYLRMVAPSDQIAATLDALLVAPPVG